MSRKAIYWLVPILLAAIVSSVAWRIGQNFKRQVYMLSKIDVYYPFSPSEEIDPRQVRSVADQVISEYAFGFYAQESFKKGLIPVLTDVHIDHEQKLITITPKYEIRDSSGHQVSQNDICSALNEFFKGTVHAAVANSLEKIECSDLSVKIHLNYIPINIDALFSATDLSIYNPKKLPISASKLSPSTGPYYIESMSKESAKLRINPYYPKELRANEIDEVNLLWTNTTDPTFLKELKPEIHNMLYMFGFQLTKRKIEDISSIGYTIEEFPSEWLMYLGFNEGLDLNTRLALGSIVDSLRDESISHLELGQSAYSISPSDRDFGLSRTDYNKVVKTLPSFKLDRHIKLGVFSEYLHSPLFRFYKEALEREMGDSVSFHIFDRQNIRKIFTPEVDAYLMVLGITPGDPLTHLAFLQETKAQFNQAVSREELEDLFKINELSEFNSKIRGFEEVVLKERLLIPLAHYPGVVAQANFLTRDEDLAWSWGVQAWTYHVR